MQQFFGSHLAGAGTAVALVATLVSSVAAVVAKVLDTRRVMLDADKRLAESSAELERSMARAEVISRIEASGAHPTPVHLGRWRTTDSAYVPNTTAPSRAARERIQLRLKEAQTLKAGLVKSAGRFRLAANGLTLTNFILGGVLASSFIQVTISPKITGFLGVLVLVSSLIKQHYQPDVDAQAAGKKALQLTGLIRTSEDGLAILDAKEAAGEVQSDALIDLLQSITRRIGVIEEITEVQDVASH